MQYNDFIKIVSNCFIYYLIGSIPMGLIISKIFKNKDLRLLGSKNIGSSNATRILGLKYGFVVFLLDFLKGFLVIIIKPDYRLLCAIATILGHMFSVFNKFKGGKAIATSVGVVTVIDPLIGILGIVFFILFIRISGYASLASLLSTSLVNVFLWISYLINRNKINIDFWTLLGFLIITILIFVKHSSNIQNLIKGTENRFNFGSKNILKKINNKNIS
ncbi:acyl-phosphate glycerol 3-phosphate acyltransferase [Candidatus Phytoplasma ziziphi]|uniref:Glycerol-3-phosphate acyltransferase n=1 Tax=Ziziphus jujuba witches'-broom phytoplasma TaxID=135727 RepID=A0A660HMF8_ZIZJU|nr:glycerol-3-phosphate 1-O-acyltransferase PlsY [Candidatus Phytoplasma ziziphi]AYJ00976.1 acyl-phosphate glycerol 3-phosphate acyltransferase [Candidatus Phytoplasma ziziphi]